jgi:hypothetical protein
MGSRAMREFHMCAAGQITFVVCSRDSDCFWLKSLDHPDVFPESGLASGKICKGLEGTGYVNRGIDSESCVSLSAHVQEFDRLASRANPLVFAGDQVVEPDTVVVRSY